MAFHSKPLVVVLLFLTLIVNEDLVPDEVNRTARDLLCLCSHFGKSVTVFLSE